MVLLYGIGKRVVLCGTRGTGCIIWNMTGS